MPTRNDNKDAEPQCNDPRDYLSDPALWFDSLPQPFRMIDQLLSDILETTWETIEVQEARRERDRLKFRVPLCSGFELVEDVTGARCVCCGQRDVVFVGCSDGLRVLRATKEGGRRPQLIGGAGGHSVDQLGTGWSGELQLVSAVGGGGALSVFAFTRDRLFLVSQLQDGNSVKVESAVLASSCSHIAIITTSSTETPPTVEIHNLPLQAWASEVEADLARQDGNSLGSTPGQGYEPPMNYSKTSLVMTIAPPPAFSPSTASDPSQALNNVATHLLSSIATGEHHLLTSKYLENRRKAFTSHRTDIQTPPSSVNKSSGRAFCHFLHCQDQASHVAVRWEDQNQVLVYKIEAPNKGSQVVPALVHPHADTISASTVSLDGRVMAVGTTHGALTLWDHQSGLYRGVVSVGSGAVTSLAFTGLASVVAGTTVGLEIIQRDSGGAWAKNTALLYSEPSPVKVVTPSLSARGLCCSVTVSGTVVVWSVCKGRPICQLEMPTSTTVLDSMQCCCASSGHAFIVGSSSVDHKMSLLVFRLLEEAGGGTDMDSDSQCPVPENFADMLEARLREAIRNGRQA